MYFVTYNRVNKQDKTFFLIKKTNFSFPFLFLQKRKSSSSSISLVLLSSRLVHVHVFFSFLLSNSNKFIIQRTRSHLKIYSTFSINCKFEKSRMNKWTVSPYLILLCWVVIVTHFITFAVKETSAMDYILEGVGNELLSIILFYFVCIIVLIKFFKFDPNLITDQ